MPPQEEEIDDGSVCLWCTLVHLQRLAWYLALTEEEVS